MAATRRARNADILVLSQVPPPVHGSTLMTRAFLEAVAKEGRSVRLIDRRFSRSTDNVGRFSVRKVVVAFSLLGRIATALLSNRRPVLVHFVTNRPFSFIVDCAVAALAHLRRASVINYVHTSGYSELASRNAVFSKLTRFLLGRAVVTVILGDALRADVAPFVASSRLRVIPNTVPPPAVETATVRPRPPADPTATPPRGPYLLFLSNLLPEKGAIDFVTACGLIGTSFPELRFVVAGTTRDKSFLRKLHQAADDSMAPDRFSFVGQVGGWRKESLLAGAHVLVFPSVYRLEAQPLTIVEALQAGLPVVAYDQGGVRDLVEQGWGRLTRPGVSDLVEGIRDVLDLPPDEYRRLKQAARHRFLSEHSFEVYSARWASVIKAVRAPSQDGDH